MENPQNKWRWTNGKIICSILTHRIGWWEIFQDPIFDLVGGLEHGFYDFPYIGHSNPNWRTHIFQRGRYTTNPLYLILFGHLRQVNVIKPNQWWSKHSPPSIIVLNQVMISFMKLTYPFSNYDWLKIDAFVSKFEAIIFPLNGSIFQGTEILAA